MKGLSKKGIGLLLAAFAGSFAVTYAANRGFLQSLIPNRGTGNIWKPELSEPAKPALTDESASASGGNILTLPQKENQTTFGLGTQMLLLSQGGYVSKRLLGCWHGTTAEQPTDWRLLSPLGAIEHYHRDNIDLCLNWKNDKLEVTDRGWSCAGCSYSSNRRSSYAVVSASGDRVTLEVEESAPPLRQKGREDFALNQDDTIDERIDWTFYLLGRRAVEAGTTAHLQRNHG